MWDSMRVEDWVVGSDRHRRWTERSGAKRIANKRQILHWVKISWICFVAGDTHQYCLRGTSLVVKLDGEDARTATGHWHVIDCGLQVAWARLVINLSIFCILASSPFTCDIAPKLQDAESIADRNSGRYPHHVEYDVHNNGTQLLWGRTLSHQPCPLRPRGLKLINVSSYHALLPWFSMRISAYLHHWPGLRWHFPNPLSAIFPNDHFLCYPAACLRVGIP